MRHGLCHENRHDAALTDLADDLELFGSVMVDPDWRNECFKNRGTFSAITTYLAQLMAHDLVMSKDVDTSLAGVASRPKNLRERALQLNTIYGHGMHVDHGLYINSAGSALAESAKFKILPLQTLNGELHFLSPRFQLLVTQRRYLRAMEPILADRRNTDNTILMLLSALFMAFHNKQVDASRKASKAEKFIEARIKTILTWHNIICSDVLAQVTKSTPVAVAKATTLNGATIQAAFRCFHSLVLPDYEVRKGKVLSLEDLLSTRGVSPVFRLANDGSGNHTELDLWADTWAIDWHFFFRNRTCFSPSISAGFDPKDIFEKDLEAVTEQGPSPEILLPASIKDDVLKTLTEMSLYLGGCQQFSDKLANSPPLIVQLLCEAYVKGEAKGTLGPAGSHIVRTATTARLDATKAHLRAMFPDMMRGINLADLPRNFSSFFNEVDPNPKEGYYV